MYEPYDDIWEMRVLSSAVKNVQKLRFHMPTCGKFSCVMHSESILERVTVWKLAICLGMSAVCPIPRLYCLPPL